MPQVSRTAKQRLGVAAAALAAAFFGLAGPAQAGDLYQPYGTYEPRGPYGPPPVVVPGPPAVVPGPVYGEPRYVPPPVIERRVVIDEPACRIVHRRHVDPWGREVIRRVRVCDEGVVERHPRWATRDWRYGYDPYYDAPRPPRAVRPGPYDDLD
jgi:hypothetical protein